MLAALLLHGFTGAPSSWDAVRAKLPPSCTVVAPWLTGHGLPPAAVEVEDFEAEVSRLAGLAPSGGVLAGYSLGGRLALGLALREPQRFQRLVLISANAGLSNPAARAERRERDRGLAALLRRDGLEAFVDHWEREPLFATQARLPDPLRATERGRRLAHTAIGLARSLETTGLAEMPDYWGRLGELTLPVELVCGELDAKFCDVARSVVGELPEGRFTCVEGAGHNLLLERPDAVQSAILRGLRS